VHTRELSESARGLHTIGNAEQTLHVMSNLVGYDVGLCEIATDLKK
jgi:hypothetical protein